MAPLEQMDELEAVDTFQQGADIRLLVISWGYKDREILSSGLKCPDS